MNRPFLPIAGLLAALLSLSYCKTPERSPAERLLAQSIAYHDPDGAFMRHVHQIDLREKRPGRSERETTITFDGMGTELALVQQRDGHLIEAKVSPDSCHATLDGETTIPDSLVTRYRLNCEGLQWVRDFYAFLFALPMKISAPGTHLDPDVTSTTFQRDPVDALRVTFDAEVGTDTWLLYFDPDTHALVGYRFFHDEEANDGEYVVLNGEIAAAGIRIPRERHWYINADDRFLGTDVVERYEVMP